ncbi:DUF5362 domain-containing protein [Gallaecimonas sp. GXIMD4217]|uniref:DUF5362 domain-containing protein n=1 Tax=Gallaecimonas sp. GXIMD4217 TaxID=3131927 RepID=UPI00311B3DAE
MDTQTQTLVKDISTPLFQAKGWMKLLGVMSIIGGVLTGLTIVGLVIAWLPIWMGVLLFQSAGALEAAQHNGSPEVASQAMAKLKTYFTIMGVFTLIAIILNVVLMLLGGAAALVGIAG